MGEIKEIRPGLWTFPIVLPENPLKWLNCYVIKGLSGEKNLLIDTGFRRPECSRDLLGGMSALGITPENTDVFLTHLHSDHTGNAGMLSRMGAEIYISRIDYGIEHGHAKDIPKEERGQILWEGISEQQLRDLYDNNQGSRFNSDTYEAHLLEDGDVLHYGGYVLRCIHTPGHTPGHMCLYAEKERLMFVGDHVLFDISPNITRWPTPGDSLGEYIKSLNSFKQYDVELALPAHRHVGSIDMKTRIDQLLEHHERRLQDTVGVIRQHPGQTAYEIAARMNWNIRAKSWDEFPDTQKWFAFLETLAHLDYLSLRGDILKRTKDRSYYYYPNDGSAL